MTYVMQVWEERKKLQVILAKAYAEKDEKTVKIILERLQQISLARLGF